MLEKGIKPVYVFDGTPPSLKEMEIKRRAKLKEEALIKYEKALKEGDLEKARTYAQATAQLKDDMVKDAKRLLESMGIPYVQAPSEGEAQAAHMAAEGRVWATASQDYDSLLFGAPRLVRNVTISGRRKLPRKPVYIKIVPELVELEEMLAELGITREQLVDLGILVGTDYNPTGVKGLGPKTSLKLVREYGSLEKLLPVLKNAEFPADPLEIRKIFLNPRITSDYTLTWKLPDVEGVVQFLCHERDFNEERVRKALEKAIEGSKKTGISTLEAYL